MSYEIIPNKYIEEVIQKKQNDEDPSGYYKLRGSGDSLLDLTKVDSLIDGINDELDAFIKNTTSKQIGWEDEFEGQSAGRIYTTLNEIDVEILDDEDFWLFLSVEKFWKLVSWRAVDSEGNLRPTYKEYFNGKDGQKCVLIRIFLRGKLTQEATGSTELAKWSELRKPATDLWASTFLRPSNWELPKIMAKILNKFATDETFQTGQTKVEGETRNKIVRVFTKNLGRRRSTLLLHSLTDKQTDQIFNELITDSLEEIES